MSKYWCCRVVNTRRRWCDADVIEYGNSKLLSYQMITLDLSISSHDVKIVLCLWIQTQIYQSACRWLVPLLAGGHQSKSAGPTFRVWIAAPPQSLHPHFSVESTLLLYCTELVFPFLSAALSTMKMPPISGVQSRWFRGDSGTRFRMHFMGAESWERWSAMH